MKDQYSENYKTLKKDTGDDKKKWKDIQCSWIERINTVKSQKYPKQSTNLMQYLPKYPWCFSWVEK